jgi:predicted RNA-binding protein (TIGR00451 family)
MILRPQTSQRMLQFTLQNCFTLPYVYTLPTLWCRLLRNNQENLEKIRRIADYQLGNKLGTVLFPDNVIIVLSKRTGRIRHVYLKRALLATLRPTDGMFSLTLEGARQLLQGIKSPRRWVRVCREASPFIGKGKSVFAKHVIAADPEIRPQEEVIVLDAENNLLAVGRAILTGREMKAFRRGLAVRVRKGAEER